MQSGSWKKEGTVPEVSLENEKKVQDLLITEIEAGKIIAAHDLSEGGLLVCLAEMLFGENKLGASLSIPETGRLDATLFGETQGQVLVAVSSSDSSDSFLVRSWLEFRLNRLGKQVILVY